MDALGSQSQAIAYSQFQAKLSYSKSTFDGVLDIGGKKMNAQVSIEQLSFEFKMESSYRGSGNFLTQGALEDFDISKVTDMLKNIDTKKIGYEGKSLEELSASEANEIIGENGFFSIENTAKRIADFVLNGAGDNPSMLRAGRDGIAIGLKMAEDSWGGKLPDIAYATSKLALELIDKRFEELGISILDENLEA